MKNQINPYRHQKLAIDDITSSSLGLLKKDRVFYISACGSGKSNTALWSIEKYLFEDMKLEKSISVFFYPSLALISQSFKNYKNLTCIKNYQPIFICSDNSIANNEDMSTEELQEELGDYLVTTNKEDIAKYLQSDLNHKVIYCTYQSSMLVASISKELNLQIDISIFDEAHNIALNKKIQMGAKTSILYDKHSPTPNDEYLNTKKRLFMTATPKHADENLQKNKTLNKHDVAYSMSDKSFFGEVAHEFSMREAISQDIISDYKIIAIHIDKEYMDKHIIEIQGDENYIEAIKTIAIVKAMQKYDIDKAIVFNKSIEYSQIFTNKLQKYHKEIKSQHIDGSMNQKEKNDILTEFSQSSKYVLSNSKLLSEGVDIPTVDMVAFMNNTSSLKDIVQRVGRCQRIPKHYKDNNIKKIGYIFIPIIEDENTCDSQIDFNQNRDLLLLFNVVNSLKSVDSQLVDSIQYTSQQEIEAIKYRIESLLKLKIKTPQELQELNKLENELAVLKAKRSNIVIENFSDLHRNNNSKIKHDMKSYQYKKEIFENYVEAMILGKNYDSDSTWNANYRVLKDFYLEYGFKPKQQETHKQYSIGSWTLYQRIAFNKKLLSAKRIEKLKLLDKDFFEMSNSKTWQNHYEEVKIFFKKNKTLPKEKDKQNKLFIGRWLVNQRYLYKNNQLSEDKIVLMLKIKKDILDSAMNTKWQKRYDELILYIKKNSTFPLRNKNALGYWIQEQQRLYKSNKLSNEKTKLLLKIDENFFDIKKRQKKNWLQLYNQFQNDYQPNKKESVSDWHSKQRSLFKRGVLSEDKVQKLSNVDDYFLRDLADV